MNKKGKIRFYPVPVAVGDGVGGPPPIIEPKTITENGTYIAPLNVDGFNPITVNVQPLETPNEWKQYIDIFEANKNANSRILLVLSDSMPTFVFNQQTFGNVSCIYRTSDGETYNSNETHTWNTNLDIPDPINDGRFIRWIIVDSIDSIIMCGVNDVGAIFSYIGNYAEITSISFSDAIFSMFYYDETITFGKFMGFFPTAITFRKCYSMKYLKKIDAELYYFSNSFERTSISEISVNNNIMDYMFLGCSRLKEITISSNVTSLGLNAFLECVSLLKINIDEGWVIPNTINIKDSLYFPESAAKELFENAGATTNNISLIFNENALSRYSADTIAIATNKGYTVIGQ